MASIHFVKIKTKFCKSPGFEPMPFSDVQYYALPTEVLGNYV